MQRSKALKSVFFMPEEKKADFSGRQSLLHLALDNGIAISHSCGGMGTCGTCRVFIESNPKDLPPRNKLEQEMAEDRGFVERERLACQIEAQAGMRVRILVSDEEQT